MLSQRFFQCVHDGKINRGLVGFEMGRILPEAFPSFPQAATFIRQSAHGNISEPSRLQMAAIQPISLSVIQ
jgi:hypothetical protein